MAPPMTGTYITYYAAGVLISWPFARIGVDVWNVLAQNSPTIPALPNGSDVASAATLGGVIAWLLAKTIPKLSDDHRAALQDAAKTHAEAMDRVTDTTVAAIDKLNATMEGVRSEVRAGADSQLALLRATLHGRHDDKGMGS